MKSLLFLHHGGEYIRGSEKVLLNLLNNLNHEYYYPIVMCNSEMFYNTLINNGIKSYLIEYPEIFWDKNLKKFQFIKFLKSFNCLNKIIKEENVELIYSNSGLPTQLGLCLAKLNNISIITHLHAPHDKRHCFFWLLKYADARIFVSKYIKQDMEQKINFNGNNYVVYNGFEIANGHNNYDKKTIDATKIRLNINDNDIVLAQIGSLIHRKGFDILFHAFSSLLQKHQNLKLLIIGDGSLKSCLKNLVKKLNIRDYVEFLGETNDVDFYLKHIIHLNILAARSDALPTVLIEAALHGVPSVASSCGGIPEIIDDEISGLLFKCENIDDLILKIDRIIKNDELRKQLGSNAQLIAKEHFSNQNFVETIEDVITSYC
jgi:glycosyltransferase involved in cell wall biosynthesis